MSLFKKNTAVTGFPFGLVSATDGSAITTGTVTGYVTLDGGTQATIAGSATHEGNGQWSINLTAGEMNGDVVGLLFTHASAIPVHYTIKTDTKVVSDLNDLTAAAVNAEVDTALSDYDAPTKAELDAGLAALNDLDAAGIRTAVGLASANLDTQLAALPTASEINAEVDTALADIHLDHLLAVDYDPAAKPGVATALLNELVESDAGVSRFTVNALENGPSGSGASAAAIADAVWTEGIADHSGTPGSTAEALSDILTDTGTSIPASITALNDLDAAGIRSALGMAAADLDTQLDAIVLDTGTTLPAQITALNDLDAAGIRTALGLASANLDTQLAALPTATENADALLNRDMSAVSDTNARSPLNALRVLRNRSTAAGNVYKEDDTTVAWTFTPTTSASAEPITEIDPA